MAISTKLVYKVGTTGGTKTYTFNRADPSATTNNIRALAAGLTTHGTFFQPQVLTVNSAKLVTTTETNISLT